MLKSSSIKALPVPRVEAGPSTPAIQSEKDVWLQEWRREAGIPEERIEHLLEEDRAVAIELIGNVRSFVQAYRSTWEREEKEPLPQWDGPKAAALLVATPAPDEADAWNVLRALQQLAERGLLEPWCLNPALFSARVHELVAGRMGEGRQWMQSIWDAMLARFDRRGSAGDAPIGFEPTFEALGALAALCGRDPTEASLHDLLARRAARSSSHIAALLDTGILHPNERTRQGHTVLGEMLLRPHLKKDAPCSVYEMLRHGADPSLVDIESLPRRGKQVLLEGLLEHLGLRHEDYLMAPPKAHDRENRDHRSSAALEAIDDPDFEGIAHDVATIRAIDDCLVTALRSEDDGAAKAAVRLGAQVNRNAGGQRPIHMARTADIAEFLLRRGAKPDAVDQERRTALHHAAERGDVGVVAVLCRALVEQTLTPKELNRADQRKDTPFKLALRKVTARLFDPGSHLDVLHVLVNAGARPDARDFEQLAGVPPEARPPGSELDDLLRMLKVPGKGNGASSQLPDADAAG